MLLDGVFVRGRETATDEPCLVKLHLFAAVSAEPRTAVVAEFRREAEGKPALPFGPGFEDHALLYLASELSLDERADLFTAPEEVDAVSPQAVDRVAHDEPLAIAGVPGMLCVTDPLLHGRTHSGHLAFHLALRTRRSAGGVGTRNAASSARDDNGGCPRRCQLVAVSSSEWGFPPTRRAASVMEPLYPSHRMTADNGLPFPTEAIVGRPIRMRWKAML
jgi:hypothetical protein